MTHAELVDRGARWLRGRHGCFVVLAELRTQRSEEQPDVIGWRAGRWSVLVEAKASRADFLRDKYKSHRHPNALGLGQERWFLAPPGIIHPIDLPEGWGLAEAHPRAVRVVRMAPGSWLHERWGDRGARRADIAVAEVGLLLGALAKMTTGQEDGLRRALGLDPAPSASEVTP